MIHPSIERGRSVRAALMAIVRLAYARGCPLPRQAAIAAVLHISAPQISRHLDRLVADGAFRTRQIGRRIHIEECRL